MQQDLTAPDRSTLVAFAAAVVIGGANFIAVRFSNEELDPLFGAALRFSAAALLLLLLARVRGIPLARGREALGAVLYGVLGFGLAYALLYYALVGLTAGTTSVIMAAVPLVTLALAVVHGQERFSSHGIAGGLLAVAGIAVLSARALGGDIRPVYLIAALLGVAAVAESSVIVKGFPRPHPFVTNGMGMVTGAALLWIASLAFGETWALPQQTRTWLVLAWLVVLGSVGLFMLFLYVIERWTASASVYILALMPLVAVTLGSVLADEPITWQLVVGGALVIAAVYIGALSTGRPAAPAPVPEAAPATAAPRP